MTVKKKNLSAQMCGEIFSSSYKIRANGLFSFGQTRISEKRVSAMTA